MRDTNLETYDQTDHYSTKCWELLRYEPFRQLKQLARAISNGRVELVTAQTTCNGFSAHCNASSSRGWSCVAPRLAVWLPACLEFSGSIPFAKLLRHTT
jgi:hypothetical protein